MLRDILLNYGLLCVWLIAVIELVLTGILFIDHKAKRDPLVLWMALLGAGLFYDAAVLGLGGMILPPFLPMFSRVRFVLHGLILPLNLVICAYALPFYRKPRIATWVVTGILMAVGGAAGVMRQIGPADPTAGITRFVSVSPKESWTELVNSLLSYGTVIPVIIVGIAVCVRHKSPSILLAGLLMFGFAALGPATGNFDLIFLITMFGELFMLLFYLIFEKRHVE